MDASKDHNLTSCLGDENTPGRFTEPYKPYPCGKQSYSMSLGPNRSGWSLFHLKAENMLRIDIPFFADHLLITEPSDSRWFPRSLLPCASERSNVLDTLAVMTPPTRKVWYDFSCCSGDCNGIYFFHSRWIVATLVAAIARSTRGVAKLAPLRANSGKCLFPYFFW